MASITFNDGTSATLDNGTTGIAAGVGSRFANYVPFTRRVGDAAVALATGARSMFTFRVDYGATFEMRDVPVANLATALRLVRHLQGGGVCTVTTGDTSSRTYNNCGLDPEGTTEIAMQDAQNLLYTVRFSLINLSGADMLCTYD
jgi:hypothetical protein